MSETRTADAYYDWLDQLYELMEWQPDPDPLKTTWQCGDRGDRFGLAKRAAADTGQPFTELMSVAAGKGRACCDCELIFNCDDRPYDD